MNNIKTYRGFINEMKSEREIVRDIARHLAYDKDIIKYLNTSRSKREIGWRDMLDTKLHGNNKDYINYITKNMVADYNPQITGYINISNDEGDFDQEASARRRRFDEMDIEDKVEDLNTRTENIEDELGIDPDDDESLDRVEKALKDAGYERPETEKDRKRKEIEKRLKETSDETKEDDEEEE